MSIIKEKDLTDKEVDLIVHNIVMQSIVPLYCAQEHSGMMLLCFDFYRFIIENELIKKFNKKHIHSDLIKHHLRMIEEAYKNRNEKDTEKVLNNLKDASEEYKKRKEKEEKNES